MRILIVEDDECIAKTLENVLGNQQYLVDVANDGLMGWELVEAFEYDLILLDVILPKLDGISFCQKLRSRNYQIPVLLLTAQNSNNNKVIGLDAGADDYVVKPFEVSELLARIRVLLRRRNTPIHAILEWERLRLNPVTCNVSYSGLELNLTPKEYLLLELFLRNRHQVYSRSDILEHLWTTDEAPQEDTVTAHIKGLRHKLRKAGAPDDLIETVYGLGYRLKLPSSEKISTKKTTRIKAVGNRRRQFHLSESTANNEQRLVSCLPLQLQRFIDTEAALSDIWERLKVKSSERVGVLEQTIAALRENILTPELRLMGQQAAHKLAGALGVFGFVTASELAFEIEQILQTQEDFDENKTQYLRELVVTLRQEIQQPAFTELDKLLCHYVLDDAVS